MAPTEVNTSLEATFWSGSQHKSLKRLFAFKSTLLVPAGADLQPIRNLLPKDSVHCGVHEVETTKDISIFADELVLLRSQDQSYAYRFPQKNLSISCNTVRFVGTGDSVHFDLSPRAMDKPKKPDDPSAMSAANGVTHGDGPWEFPYSSSYEGVPPRSPNNGPSWTKSERGKDGEKGTEGGPGLNGGSFKFRGTFVLDQNENVSFCVSTSGSAGARGGQGQAGQTGGCGFKSPNYSEHAFFAETTAFKAINKYMAGSDGGSGGAGGRGGTGGNGGRVDICYDVVVDGVSEPIPNSPVTFQLNAGAGNNGSPGQGGAGGEGGDHSNVTFVGSIFAGTNVDYLRNDPWTFLNIINPGLFRDYRIEIRGYEYPKGATGKAGQDGPWNHDRATGGGVSQTRLSRTDLVSAQDFDAHQMAMVVDRLAFEHFTQYASQTYNRKPRSIILDASQRATARAWSWVSQVIPAKAAAYPKTSELSTAWRIVQGSLQSLSAQCFLGSDVFKHSLNTVPNPTMGIPNLKKLLEYLASVEAAASVPRQALEKTDNSRADMAAQITQLSSSLLNLQSAQEKEETTSNKLRHELLDATHTVEKRRDHLSKVVGGLKDSIEVAVECEYDNILSALGSVVKKGRNMSAGDAAGAVWNIGNGAYKDWKKATQVLRTGSGDEVQKTFVLDNIQSLVTLEGDALRKHLQTEAVKIQAAAKTDPSYLAHLEVDAGKFDELCRKYLDRIKTKDGIYKVRDAFADLMDAIRYKNELIMEYNSCQARRLQLQTDQDNVRDGVLHLTDSTSGLPDDTELQLAGAFLVQAESDLKKRAFGALYEAARNFNCVALGPTSVFRCLERLQSFSGLNGTVLKAGVETYLQAEDVGTFEASRSSSRSKRSTIEVRLTREDIPEWFREVRGKPPQGGHPATVSRRLTVTLSASDPPEDFDKSYWDIRLEGLEVYLPGAVQRSYTLGGKGHHGTTRHRSDPNTGIIAMGIYTPGLMSYKDKSEKAVVHDFQLPPVTTTFAYSYDAESEGQEPFSIVTSSDDLDMHMKFQLDEREVALPMQSPFATWVIQPHDNVDLTGCDEVQMLFDVTFQTVI